MPKRGKIKSGDGREQYEGRPAELTFAAFLSTSTNETQATLKSQETKETATASASAEEQIQDDIFPEQFSNRHEQGREYTVTRTKKRKLPITYENRSKGKKVTVVSNITGNAEVLVVELRKRLGVGGVSRGTFIELQGDQQKFVEQFLKNHPCVK